MPINISLPDGSIVDVETKNGANHFISYGGPSSFKFFSTNLKAVDETYSRIERRRRKKPTAKETNELVVPYATAAAMARNSDPEIFATIPQSEIELYMDHIMKRIVYLTSDPGWIRTGTLVDMHEKIMLYGFMELLMHAVPCKLAFDKDFFGVLAKFVAAPSAVLADDAESISMLVANAVIAVVFNKDILSSPEKAFRKLESCGMLERFICLSTGATITGQRCILKFYDELILCSSFIKKKFAIDQPCGQMAAMMLERPSLRYHYVAPKLQTIMSTSMLANQKVETPSSSLKEGVRSCRLCNKMDQSLEFQQSLKKCSRCKSAFYCSRECQVKDWKSHKVSCKPVSHRQEKKNLFNENTVLNFMMKNYVAIMKEIVKVEEETGKGKRELLIELDFATPEGVGGAPALKDPPEFKIAESKGYFEGSRPNEPRWLTAQMNQDADCYKKNVKALTRNLRDTYNRLTDIHLLGFVRSPTEDFGFYRLQLQSPIGKQMYSDEAVIAARVALKDNDFKPFEAIMGVESDNSKACMRTVRQGFGGLPSETELDAVREMLNRNFGADF